MIGNNKEQLVRLNQQFKAFDALYHDVAAKFELSDSAFWILYALCESEREFTQNDLCDDWFYPKQTVNSAISNLVKSGYVRLEVVPGTRNRKIIRLTDAGYQFSQQNVQALMKSEQRAFDQLTEQERQTYLALTDKHLSLLRKEIEKL